MKQAKWEDEGVFRDQKAKLTVAKGHRWNWGMGKKDLFLVLPVEGAKQGQRYTFNVDFLLETKVLVSSVCWHLAMEKMCFKIFWKFLSPLFYFLQKSRWITSWAKSRSWPSCNTLSLSTCWDAQKLHQRHAGPDALVFFGVRKHPHKKRPFQKERIVFQASFFRGRFVSFFWVYNISQQQQQQQLWGLAPSMIPAISTWFWSAPALPVSPSWGFALVDGVDKGN